MNDGIKIGIYKIIAQVKELKEELVKRESIILPTTDNDTQHNIYELCHLRVVFNVFVVPLTHYSGLLLVFTGGFLIIIVIRILTSLTCDDTKSSHIALTQI